MMKPKKDVAFLCQFFYPEYISSATLPFDIAKRYAKAGYSVGALCGYPYEYFDKNVPCNETIDNIEIKRLKYLKLKRASKLGRLLNYFSFIVQAFFYVRYLKNYKTIIVFSNPPLLPWIAKIAKKRYGCKLIFVAYDLYPEIAVKTKVINEKGIIYKLMDRLNKSFYSIADKVIALSNEMKEYIIQHRNINSNRVTVIPNWYADEYNQYEQYSLREGDIWERLSGKFVVSYLGNMGTCQDIETILETARELKDNSEYVFLFAGHGNKVSIVQEAIQNGLDNIVYYDFLHGQNYLDALRLTRCAIVSLEKGLCGLCVPSKTYAYMMYNLPIICIMSENTDIAKDVIEMNSGVVVANGDSKKIVDYLMNITVKPKIRERYLEKYTPEVALEQYKDVLAELLGDKNG